MKISLSKDLLPFNFFDQVDFSYQNTIIACIKRKYTKLNTSECSDIFERYQDDFTEKLYELRDSAVLNNYWIGDHEIDEATGTWGYSNYEIIDVKIVRKELENEVGELMEEVLQEIATKKKNFEMNKKSIKQLRQQVEKGQFPNKYKEFGGADLIITSDMNRKHEEYTTMVYTEHAAAMSWLVYQLKDIYDNDLDWRNKYDFYPFIGKLVNDSLTSQDKLFDSMLFVIDVIEDSTNKN